MNIYAFNCKFMCFHMLSNSKPWLGMFPPTRTETQFPGGLMAYNIKPP